MLQTLQFSRKFKIRDAGHIRRFCSENSNKVTEQVRRRSPIRTEHPRPLIVACPPMKSNINLSAIARASSCMGVSRLILCGNSKLWPHISRQGCDNEGDEGVYQPLEPVSSSAEHLESHPMNISIHRTLLPVLIKLKKQENYKIVAVEQTCTSKSIYDFKWPHKTVIVVGHESNGISQDILDICDLSVEIPLYGLPFSLNVSHALAIALNDYCKQYPSG